MSILPRKPQAGDGTLQSIYNTVCNIIDYLPSLEVRGDNKTIRANSFGSGKTLEVIGRASSATQSGTKAYNGPFAISQNDKGGLDIQKGTLNRNGNLIDVPSGVLASPKDGYVCVTSEIQDTRWTTPKFEIVTSLKNSNAPVGYCKKESQDGEASYSITQYYTGMAMIIITAQCPLATN